MRNDNLERPASINDGLWSGLLAKVRRMEQQELSYYRAIQPLFDQLFPSYLQQLRTQYYTLFSPLLAGATPVFDLTTAARHAVVPTWTADLDAMLTAIEDEWEETLEAELTEAHDDGWYWSLWALALQDDAILDGEAPDDLIPPDNVLPYLIAGAIGGLAYAARAQAWRVQAVDKARQQIGAIVVQGGTWAEVETVLGRVLQQFRQGLASLGADELYLARVHGEDRALQAVAAGGFVAHLWITRADEKVCRVCAPLHLTRTDLRPVHDTHPQCRCITVPLLDTTATGSGATFDAFIRSLGGTSPVVAF
jgi:hypothetical protein